MCTRICVLYAHPHIHLVTWLCTVALFSNLVALHSALVSHRNMGGVILLFNVEYKGEKQHDM